MSKWLPWKFIAKYVARSQGFIDPVSLYASLQNFSQPSEVAEPVELLRAGIVFHARGLINSKVIQHNLDWVWPFWAERQFDPADPAFLPRAFSITHVNLTHRNWSAIGIPGVDAMPIVDPRGLLTPFWDSWSIDAWVITDQRETLLPSRASSFEQHILENDSLILQSHVLAGGLSLTTNAEVQYESDHTICTLTASALLDCDGWLIISARPYNPEGVSFIHDIKLMDDRCGWSINKHDTVRFDRPVERHHTSDYRSADVYIHLLEKDDTRIVHCPVGMATAAAMFRVKNGIRTDLRVSVPLHEESGSQHPVAGKSGVGIGNSTIPTPKSAAAAWQSSLTQKTELHIPDTRFTYLYDAAVRTLILCTPGDVYAGPYTYKRYWYRDAVFICHGLLCAGLVARVADIAGSFPERQKRSGYFHSQQGEWDSNGQVLWMIDRYCRFSGQSPGAELWPAIQSGANWIVGKRMPASHDLATSGLLPAGFSAEHLGPNDYYYWDDFWAVAGLESAAHLSSLAGSLDKQEYYRREAESMRASVEGSLEYVQKNLRMRAIPAAPDRRLDAGAIGSIVASYPTQVLPADDERLLGTVEFLLKNSFYKDGFFQDMIHSGVNAYLTLQVAQALLRNGDQRYFTLMKTIADLASPTGHWPEAIHPHTGGGCMGDGHHAWAAAEWVAMIRYCFIREEAQHLVLGSGIPREWLTQEQIVSFGPAPTCFGTMTIQLTPSDPLANTCEVKWQANWHADSPDIRIAIPGYIPVDVSSPTRSVVVQRSS